MTLEGMIGRPVAPYAPHGAALLAFEAGDHDARLVCWQDGARDDVPAAFWFREAIDPMEEAALALCRGRVIDLGAGAGVHALRLQARGLDVTALDVEPACVAVMRRRGVRQAVAGDLLSFRGGPFDTAIALCNGLDKVGRLRDLPRFLDAARRLLAPNGQLLADSFEPLHGAHEAALERAARKVERGRYVGEVDLRFAFGDLLGAPFTALHVGSRTLEREAAAAGWGCEVLMREGGHFLACLTPRAARPALPASGDGWTIRPARPEDEPAIGALVRAERLNPMGLGHAAFVVAEAQGAVVGAAQLRRHPDGSRELGSLVVAPPWRGRGLGSALVSARLAGEAGPVHVITPRARAAFHGRWGFGPLPPGAGLPWAVRRNLLMGQLLGSLAALARGRRPRRLVALLRPAPPSAEAGAQPSGQPSETLQPRRPS